MATNLNSTERCFLQQRFLSDMANQQQVQSVQVTSPAPPAQNQGGSGGGVQVNMEYLKSIPAAFKVAEFVSNERTSLTHKAIL